MIPEKEREALMRLTMCAREECIMCKYQGDCNFDFQYELATKNMNILAEALRKLSSSEKPNNYCDDCLYTDTCDSKEFFYACTSKATISKMEQVDKDINVRSKDEPTTQTETQNSNLTFEKRTMRDCYNCKRYETEGECIECHYEPKDEPQDEYAKEYEELGLRKLKELRKDEPQTDCAWK